MNAIDLQKSWINSETHILIGNKMSVLSENEFKIENVILNSFEINSFGLYLQFDINNISHFLNVLDENIAYKFGEHDLTNEIVTIDISQTNQYLCLSFFKNNSKLYQIKCCSISMGPVNGNEIFRLYYNLNNETISLKNEAVNHLLSELSKLGICFTWKDDIYSYNLNNIYLFLFDLKNYPYITLLLNEIKIGNFLPLIDRWEFHSYKHNKKSISEKIGKDRVFKTHEECARYIFGVFSSLRDLYNFYI